MKKNREITLNGKDEGLPSCALTVTDVQFPAGTGKLLCRGTVSGAPEQSLFQEPGRVHQQQTVYIKLAFQMNSDRLHGNWNPRTDVVSTFVIISSQSRVLLKGQ